MKRRTYSPAQLAAKAARNLAWYRRHHQNGPRSRNTEEMRARVIEARTLEGLSLPALAVRFPMIKPGRIRLWIKGTPHVGKYPISVRRRAWDLRAAGYQQAEIAKRIGVSEQIAGVWLRNTGVASILNPEHREQIAVALRGGESPEILAGRFGYAETSIQKWIREGKLPARAILTKTCKACGAEYQGPTRQAGACSDRCRRALANACRIASRWRAHGRRVSPAARELMIAQSFLRVEIAEGIGG